MNNPTQSAATAVAQLLFDKGIRLQSIHDNGALLLVSDRDLKNKIVSAYRSAFGDDIEVTVNFSQLADAHHNALQLLYDNCFDDMQRGDISEEIDCALWALCMVEDADLRDAEIIRLGRERAA